MSVLILKNIAAEGPGTIGDFLLKQGIPFRVVELESEGLPDAEGFDALVMMGGPMSVNDDIPYIRREEELVREFIGKGKKVFGVCLGAQIMAKALGAKVYAGPQKEIGWYDIELTDEGVNDPFMRKLLSDQQAGTPAKAKVFQWHGETFDIPVGAVRIASSGIYPNQAFKYGSNAYACQFHIEVRKEMIYEWLKDEPVDMNIIRQQTESLYEDYLQRAMNFYEGFFVY
jgi:GMP synthase-like glutamine amidotransferase